MFIKFRPAAFLLGINIVFVVAVLPSFAQERSSASHAAAIRGRVIDSKSGQPLNGATVSLQSLQGHEGNAVGTSSDGGFSFSGLGAGRYRLTVFRNGYLDSGNRQSVGHGAGGRGTHVSLAAGQELGDVVLRLTPTAVIAGRVVNEREEPMPGVFVQTMKASYRSGRRELADARAGLTDDRGEYRVWGLAPGKYYLKVTNPRSRQWGSGPSDVYVPTFYPGVFDPVQGQAVEVRPGDEVGGINLTLSPSRTVHVRGRILTSNGGPAKGAEVTFFQAGGFQSGNGYSVQAEADATGKFEIASVAPGSYIVEAELSESSESGRGLTGRSLIGRSPIHVSESGADNFDLVVFPGATVSGRVRAPGERKVNLARISASLIPLDSSDSATNVEGATVQPDGTFTFHDVPEGNYRIRLSPVLEGYYVTAGDADAEARVEVSHGHASPAEVRLTPGAGRIQGVVHKGQDSDSDSDSDKGKQNDQAMASASATVVLVPEGKRRADPDSYREAITDQSGKFVLGSVPPGSYTIFAWQGIDDGAYMDPYFIQQYESLGKPVRVEEGSNLTLQVQLADQGGE